MEAVCFFSKHFRKYLVSQEQFFHILDKIKIHIKNNTLNNKYNQKLPHFQITTIWMGNNDFLVVKSVYSAFTC